MESQAPDVDGVVYLRDQGSGIRDQGLVGEFVKVRLEKVKGFDFVGVVV